MTGNDGSEEVLEDRGFVGRDRELAELIAGLQDVFADRGAMYLITGEPGAGKTTLVRELAHQAEQAGARVLWGRCWEGGGAPPFWPWAQVLQRLSAAYDEDSLRRHIGRGAPHILHLLPALAELLPAVDPNLAHESEAGRLWLFEAVATFLANAASDQPLVLIIDDLHAADPSSLLLLRFLAGDVRSRRLLVAATYRNLEVPQSRESAAILRDLAAEGRLIGLRGLGIEEASRLIAQQTGATPRAEHLAAIHRATGGNPLFVRELARLITAGDLFDQAGEAKLTIPESVRAAIRRRLSPLSAHAFGVLAAAAVVGSDFDLALLTPTCKAPTEQVLAGLSEAVTVGIVAGETHDLGTYRFAHPLVRDVIYEALPLPARAQLHQRVGEAIERLRGENLDLHLDMLAHHFAKAVGQGAKARDYARLAGDRAMATFAFEDAAIQYGRALAILDDADSDEVLRGELLLRQGGAQARAGDYKTAKETFLLAVESARWRGDHERLGLAVLGFGEPQVEGGLVDRQLVGLLQEALGVLGPDDRGLRARLLARLSLELAFADETELRESSSRDALETARQLDDTGALGIALRARWMAVWGPDGLDERRDLEQEMLNIAARTGDPEIELVGRARRIASLLQAGHVRTVETEIAAHARLAGHVRMPFHLWTMTTLRAMQAHLHGSLPEAEALADEALAMDPTRPNGRFAHLDLITLIRWEQGHLGELREPWRKAVEDFPLFGYARGWLCLADAESGHVDAAEERLRSLVELVPELPRNGLWLPTVAVASLVVARLEARHAAAAFYPLLQPYRGQSIIIPSPHPVVCMGSTALYLALLAATLSLDEADDLFETALEANASLRARTFLVRTQYEYARMLISRDRSGDTGRAYKLLEHAATRATSMGLAQIIDAVERTQAGQQVAADGEPVEAAVNDVGGVAAASASLFRSEGEYWTIRYEGSVARLRDSKGLWYLARLLVNPGRELHAVDLEAAIAEDGQMIPSTSGEEPGELTVRADLGDAGELLDTQAKAAYKARLDELRAGLDEAERFNDQARATAAREELDFLTSELARAVGLGGRDRKAASHAERARLNVTRAIRAAIRNIERANPALGQHLTATIRTGRYCSYTPDPRAAITWES